MIDGSWDGGDHGLMAHPSEVVIRRVYETLNRGDMNAFVASWTPDAVLHGGGGLTVTGAEEIGRLLEELRDATGGTLRWDLHDVLANDEHAVALRITRADRMGRTLVDRVASVFHLKGEYIAEAWFHGDPRIQADFYGGDA